MNNQTLLTIDELSDASGLTKRTIRYYVTAGLIDRPSGETRSARYDAHHLEQIRNIKALQDKGFTLARILDVKRQTKQEILNRREIGKPLTLVEIPVDRGISLQFRQELCGLTQPQMVKLADAFLELLKNEQNQNKLESEQNDKRQ